MYSLYLISNRLSSKLYVGFTKFNIEKRFKQHFQCSKQPKWILHEAMAKHPRENWTIKLLDQTESLIKARQLEQEYISQFKSKWPNGYNMTDGGNTVIHSESTKKKMSQSHRGVKFSKTHKKHMKENHWSKTKVWSPPVGSFHANARTYEIITPYGEVFIVKGLEKFCRDNKLSRSSILYSARNNCFMNGWKCNRLESKRL